MLTYVRLGLAMFTSKHVHCGLGARDRKAEVWLCRTAVTVNLGVGAVADFWDACGAAGCDLTSWKTSELLAGSMMGGLSWYWSIESGACMHASCG